MISLYSPREEARPSTIAPYELRAAFLPASARVVSFEGQESIGSLYHFEVTVVVPLEVALELDLDAATGTLATLRINDDKMGAVRRQYHGVVSSLELIGDREQFSVFRVHLVPKLWRLTLGEHSRVFVDKSVPEIIRQTLEEGGLTASDYELRLTRTYERRSYVCQYRESRFAFALRWLQRVGAYFFFEQADEHDKVVIADESTQAPALDVRARFVQSDARHTTAKDVLHRFRWHCEVMPRTVRVTDYDYLKPLLSVVGSATVVPNGPGGDVRWFDVNEDSPAKVRDYAKTRALQYLAGRSTYRGQGRVLGLTAGYTFALEGHPRTELDRRYLITGVRHRGSQISADTLLAGFEGDVNDVYSCEISAVDSSAPWFPPETVPWPRIAGTVRARIDGPADSDYAQIDADGRYLVRLMFDESGLADGSASSRVRMLQPHAGNPEGFHLPLRKGTEVQIGFLKGDPDQPVITGTVANPLTPSPVTNANRTQNVLQTGGLNRLEIDDTEGSQYIDWSSPPEQAFLHLGAHAGLGSHNYALSTAGDLSLHTGGNLDIAVGGKQTETVAGNVTETYQANQTTTVAGPLHETIDGGMNETIHAGLTQTVDGHVAFTVTGDESRNITAGETTTIVGGWTRSVTGSVDETIHGPLTRTITGDVSVQSPAGHTVIAIGGHTLSTPGKVTFIAKGGFHLLAPGGQRRLDQGWFTYAKQLSPIDDVHIHLANYRCEVRYIMHAEAFALQATLFGTKRTVGILLANTAGLVESASGGFHISSVFAMFHGSGGAKHWG
jgi:type VI secretion system secreted protein VgrG